MLKYVDFWYAVEIRKGYSNIILEGDSTGIIQARAKSRNKNSIMLQDDSRDWRFSYLPLCVGGSI